MTDLLARLEVAEAGSRELDYALERTFSPHGLGFQDSTYRKMEDRDEYVVPPYTTCVTAALALAERVLPGWTWLMASPAPDRSSSGRFYARVASPDFESVTWEAGDRVTTDVLSGRDEKAEASTPALALCIAILKATHKAEGAEG